jgi:hypothetical protein
MATSFSGGEAGVPGGGARVAQWVRSLDLTTHTSLSPIRRGFAPSCVNYKKGCTRLATASDKVNIIIRWHKEQVLKEHEVQMKKKG